MITEEYLAFLRTQEEHDPCSEPTCGARFGHHPLCSHGSPAEKSAQLRNYFTRYIEELRLRNKRRDQVVFWQGKFAMVTHENNRLRAKLRRLEAERKR